MDKVDSETLDKMVEAFGRGWNAEHLESDGMSREGDRRRAGLTKALKVIGVEVDDSWRRV